MSKEISIVYKKSIDKLFNDIKILMKSQKGYINGDKNIGLFEVESPIGLFKGKYKFQNNIITLTIDKKPFLISHSLIENQIKNYLNNN